MPDLPTRPNFLVFIVDQMSSFSLGCHGNQDVKTPNMDETKARVEGKNYHTHIVCNPFYTAYFTTEHKDRLTTLKILLNNSELKYCLNQQAFTFLGQLNVGQKHINQLNRLQSDKEYNLLGRFNGRYLTSYEIPSWSWLSRGGNDIIKWPHLIL